LTRTVGRDLALGDAAKTIGRFRQAVQDPGRDLRAMVSLYGGFMKILVANHRLDGLGGTETYVLTLTEQLLALGHEVTCFSPTLGMVAGDLRAMGAGTVDDARDAPPPDVLHVSHLDAGHLAMAAWPLTPTVFVVHGNGTRAVVERPPLWRDTVQVWVAVSGYVADVMSVRDGIERKSIEVVPNLIDLRHFAPLQPIRSPAQNVFVHSNHYDGPLSDALTEACSKIGASLRIGGGNRRQHDLVSELNYADVVVGIGRSALEGMACGRPVLLYSSYGGDGLCRPDSAERDLEWNYNGLSERITPDSGLLAEELELATQELGAWSREWVERHHDPRVLVPLLVQLYEEAIARGTKVLEERGSADLLKERFSEFYPSLRWWHRAPGTLDWDRTSTPFPVWAPDVDDELPVLLSALQHSLQSSDAETRVARAGEAEARTAAEQARSELQAIRVTRTWRLREWLVRPAIVRRFIGRRRIDKRA